MHCRFQKSLPLETFELVDRISLGLIYLAFFIYVKVPNLFSVPKLYNKKCVHISQFPFENYIPHIYHSPLFLYGILNTFYS